ncbi:MAG: SPFH domain-containing protein [bacterium]
MKKTIKKLIPATLLGLLLISQSGCILHHTKSNEVGVKTVKWSLLNKKGIDQKIFPPASTYFFLPLINDWHTFDINLQNIHMTFNNLRGDVIGQDDIKFKTIDGNDIALDLVIAYRVIPEKAPYILGYVAKNDQELRNKIIRTIARSRPRDIFGELETEQFYKAELRAEKSEKAKNILNKILNPYGVIIERVLTKDYRFNTAYQQAIEDKKIADQKTEQNKSAKKAKEEEYKRKLEEAKGEVNKTIANANGQFEKAKIETDAYYIKQEKIAKAILAEGKAEAEAILKMKKALSQHGGKIMVKLEMAKALQNKKILLLPSGANGQIDLKTLDMNKLIETKGLQSLSK